MMKQPQFATLKLEKIVGGGQALGTLDDGKKAFVWGGLPGETIQILITKKKSHFVEGIVTEVTEASPQRITPKDPDSYLSTSPWQIMDFSAEQHYKSALVEEAFELHDIVLPHAIDMFSDNRTERYRNKVEFSWYGRSDEASEKEFLDLAFFRRGSKGKIIINDSSLLPDSIMTLAREIRDLLAGKNISARQLKTLLIRCDQKGNCVWQLYIKDKMRDLLSEQEMSSIAAQGGELIYSDPRSPASRITERLRAVGDVVLADDVLGVPFRYATEGFFQVNIPVYEEALKDMKKWIDDKSDTNRIIDLYSGVGSIGLTISGEKNVTLIEINEDAVREMKQNIERLGRSDSAEPVLAASEKALEHLGSDSIVILDPPRAGLHTDVIERLLEKQPPRIIYLSCNPVTQARDVALLATTYGIRAHRGYNFFPRTPHIEHLVILDLKA